MVTIKDKNGKFLKDFTAYCRKHKGERFWQALRNWSKAKFILKSTHFDSEMFDNKFIIKNSVGITDTYYLN